VGTGAEAKRIDGGTALEDTASQSELDLRRLYSESFQDIGFSYNTCVTVYLHCFVML